MLYHVLVEAEIDSDLPIEKIEKHLQLSLVNSQGNGLFTDNIFFDKFAVNDYHTFEIQRIPDECIFCGELMEDRMVEMFYGILEEKEICIDPGCEGNRYYGK